MINKTGINLLNPIAHGYYAYKKSIGAHEKKIHGHTKRTEEDHGHG